MGLKDLGFKYFKSVQEFEDLKILYETKVTKKNVFIIAPCDMADQVAKHVIYKFNDKFKARIILYT
jgi:hypothetical protein